MATTHRTMPHPPEAVFSVLADGWRYPEWVVGAKRIRSVDDGWPSPGTCIHHVVGVGPLELKDRTTSVAVDPPRCLVLEARAWPAGKAQVTITITAVADGCEVVMHEVPTAGPAKTLDNPAFEGLTHVRNLESLRRLERAAATSARV